MSRRSTGRSPNTGTPCAILAAASGLHGASTIFQVERGVACDGVRVREVRSFKSESLIPHVASFLVPTSLHGYYAICLPRIYARPRAERHGPGMRDFVPSATGFNDDH